MSRELSAAAVLAVGALVVSDRRLGEICSSTDGLELRLVLGRWRVLLAHGCNDIVYVATSRSRTSIRR